MLEAAGFDDAGEELAGAGVHRVADHLLGWLLLDHHAAVPEAHCDEALVLADSTPARGWRVVWYAIVVL